ncbi:hypothetical protein GOBAR_DD33256 [Gossypium barbadense]|nr:hypothetical protein GOBAR_DD33256 [Gossypium barbadense]
MVDASGGWSVQRLRMILPEIIDKRITEIIPPSDGVENDDMVRHGAFSIADSYDASAGDHWGEASSTWDLVWKTIGGVLGDSKAQWITGYAMDSLVLHSMSIVSSSES